MDRTFSIWFRRHSYRLATIAGLLGGLVTTLGLAGLFRHSSGIPIVWWVSASAGQLLLMSAIGLLVFASRRPATPEGARLRLKQLETLLQEIPEPLHILDESGRIVFWNSGAKHLYGFTAEEAIGQSAYDLLKIVASESDPNNAGDAPYSTANRWLGQLQAETKDGQPQHIERRRTRIVDNGKTVGEVIFDFDSGKRDHFSQVERRRQRLESLGTLVSGISHNLNNLLTPILMSARMLQRGGQRLDQNALLETIVAAASRGADLIGQLLTFVRGGEGIHEPVNVASLISEVQGILQHTLSDRIRLETDIPPNLPEVLGDGTEISQVIMNLAINARDAMPNGGQLKLSAHFYPLASEQSFSLVTLQPGEYVGITVSDTGVGIPMSIRDRIFDPFFSTKEPGQGTGLGLSTTLGILRSHGGAIELHSTVGQGASFTIILPIVDPSPSHSEALNTGK